VVALGQRVTTAATTPTDTVTSSQRSMYPSPGGSEISTRAWTALIQTTIRTLAVRPKKYATQSTGQM